MQLADARLVLTGASGGIGLALAEQLAQGGAQVLLVARQAAPLRPLLDRYPQQLQLVQADLTRAEGRNAVLLAAQRLGAVNGLINAAGINQFVRFEQQSDSDIEALLALNLAAPMQLTRRLLPLLKQQPKALVVNLGSTFGSIGYAGFAAYCATKFGLRGHSEALRRELADGHVKVLYLAPRATRTAMNSQPVMAMNQALGVQMDEPTQVARQVLKALRQESEERYFGWPENLWIRINSLLPRLLDGALHKQLATIQGFFTPPSSGDKP